MTNSQFCIQQRQKEQRRLNKLLIAGFVGSTAVHGIIAYALLRWSFEPPKQAEEPIEMILVDKPKPKVESKPVVEPKPKPIQPPEPVKAQTPPPPVKPPEPVKAQTAPPKPIMTDPTPAPSQPIVSAPIENTGQSSALSSSFSAPNSSVAAASSSASSRGRPGALGSAIAANSAPPRPEANDGGEEGISCVSNCEPEYPATLKGSEGSAEVKLTVNPNGKVVGAELSAPNSNSSINRQALLAARKMQFSSPGNSSAAVRVSIDFTVEGSEYDRTRREAQRRRERAARERQEQEAARQRQLEQERQARQEQLERERQARQRQEQLQQQQQQEVTPPPANTQPAPEPQPALSPEELDAERLRKFRERIESYQ
ncbi:MAG: TonB family protein [Cyanobacteria bacterium P01_G01_bin.19]